MRLTVTSSGTERISVDLGNVLRSLTVEDSRELRKVLRRAAKPFVERARSGCRKHSGELAKSIKARTVRGMIAVDVAPAKRVTMRGGSVSLGRLIEFGYMRHNRRTGAVSHISAHPFMRPAWDSESSGIEADVARGVGIVLFEANGIAVS
jgi:hypothetical protein